MIYPGTEENIRKGAEILKNGGLVAFPTETVYGLGGNALNPESVAKIFAAKQRPSFDPLISHIAEEETLDRICRVPSKYHDILTRVWPGSLTIIVPKKDIVPDLVTSGLDTMAVRMPDHPVALELIKASTGVVAAPSANPFGYLSPTRAEHVEKQLGSKIDMILDGGSCRVGVESTVLDLTQGIPQVLRPGGYSVEELETIFGEVRVLNRKVVTPTAPGQMEMHYSPRAVLHIVDSPKDVGQSLRSGAAYVGFRSDEALNTDGFEKVEYLSRDGNYIQAAARLFEILHKLDHSGVRTIYAQRVPEEGLGRAVMDRIYKASAK
jgi:L-threonylcarbamoyladenylate synthase